MPLPSLPRTRATLPVKSIDDARVPFPLLVSHFDLRRIFSKIEFADQALKAEPGDRVLRGYPKRGYEEEYSQVLMEVTPQFDVRRLVVFYPDQSVMEFSFDRIETRSAAVQNFTTGPQGTPDSAAILLLAFQSHFTALDRTGSPMHGEVDSSGAGGLFHCWRIFLSRRGQSAKSQSQIINCQRSQLHDKKVTT